MATEFVQSGYIEVWRDGEMVSRHRVEREAVESALADSENRGSGEYELRFPNVRIIVKRQITKPEAPALGTVYALSTTSLGIPLDRPATGQTQIEEYVLERRVYGGATFTEVARGIGIFGATNVYTDTGLAADTQYEYRCKAVDTTARESEWSAPSFGQTTTAVEIYAPINVTATSISGGIRVSWSPPASGLTPTSYELQRTYAADGVWSVKSTQIGTTYDDTDVAAGVAKWYRIVAINGSNRSDYSSVVTASGGASSSSARKWAPGHGVKVKDDVGESTSATLADQQSKFSKMTEIGDLGWAECRVRWGRLNTTGSTYDWTALESNLEAANAIGKKVGIHVAYKSFANGTAFLCPSDLTATAIATGSGYTMPMWRSATMDRFIAFWQAFGAAYNGDDRIQFVTFSESASSLIAPFPADFSRSALATQLKRLYTAASDAFPNTVVCANLNSLSGELLGLIEHAHANECALYTPDAIDTSAVRLFRGETVTGEGTPSQDYRGAMAFVTIASQPVLGGKDDNGPPSNVIDWAQVNDVTHLSWYVTGDLPSPNDWTSIKSAITADPDLYTTCPTNFAGGCVAY